MARPLRIAYAGAYHHVMNRGAGRRKVFLNEADRIRFLALLGELHETFGVVTHAYCLMDNHYHLVLESPRGNLSLAMRHLNGLYTQRFNRLRKTDGPLFRGRFKAIVVEADAYLAQLSRYIHLNPVEAGIVARPEAYPWSSYRAYVGRSAPPPWLSLQPTLAMVARTDAHRRYRAFVELGVDEEIRAFYGRGKLAPVLGHDSFRRRLAKRLPVASTETSEARRVVPTPSIEELLAATAERFGTRQDELLSARRGRGERNIPRLVALGLARTISGYSLQTIAKAFGLRHYASVSVAVRRFKDVIAADPALARRVDQIKKRVGC